MYAFQHGKPACQRRGRGVQVKRAAAEFTRINAKGSEEAVSEILKRPLT